MIALEWRLERQVRGLHPNTAASCYQQANPGTGKHVLGDQRYIVYPVVIIGLEPLISYAII